MHEAGLAFQLVHQSHHLFEIRMQRRILCRKHAARDAVVLRLLLEGPDDGLQLAHLEPPSHPLIRHLPAQIGKLLHAHAALRHEVVGAPHVMFELNGDALLIERDISHLACELGLRRHRLLARGFCLLDRGVLRT